MAEAEVLESRAGGTVKFRIKGTSVIAESLRGIGVAACGELDPEREGVRPFAGSQGMGVEIGLVVHRAASPLTRRTCATSERLSGKSRDSSVRNSSKTNPYSR
jgi:hypothetical protein